MKKILRTSIVILCMFIPSICTAAAGSEPDGSRSSKRVCAETQTGLNYLDSKPEGSRFIIIGCGHTDASSMEKYPLPRQICNMPDKEGWKLGTHSHDGALTVNVFRDFNPDIWANIGEKPVINTKPGELKCKAGKSVFGPLEGKFDITYIELGGVEILGDFDKLKGAYDLVRPGGVLIMDGVDIYESFTPCSFTEVRKIPGKHPLSEVFISLSPYQPPLRKIMQRGDLWPEIGYEIDNPFQVLVNINPYKDKDGDVGLETVFGENIPKWKAAKARDYRATIAREFGIPEVNINIGTASKLEAEGKNMRALLGPLGVSPIPRWKGQLFYYIKKPE